MVGAYQSDGSAIRRKIVATVPTKMPTIVVSIHSLSFVPLRMIACESFIHFLRCFFITSLCKRAFECLLARLIMLLMYDEMIMISVKKTFCPNNEFLCNSGEQCIPPGWVCDRSKDCADGSDEQSCGGKSVYKDQKQQTLTFDVDFPPSLGCEYFNFKYC